MVILIQRRVPPKRFAPRFRWLHSGKFGSRYSTLEFQDAAKLDDGDLWPVSFALQTWSPTVERKVAQLVKAAVS